MIIIAIYLLNREFPFTQSLGYFLHEKLNILWRINSLTVKRNIKSKSLEDGDFEKSYCYQKVTMIGISLTILFYLFWLLSFSAYIYVTMLCVFIIVLPELKLKEEVKRIENTMMSELPDALMSIKLLIGAGMTVEKSLNMLSIYDGLFYGLVKEAVVSIKVGQPISKVLMILSSKCQMPSVTRLCRVLITDEKNGNLKTQGLLEELCDDMWKQKRALYLKRGEEASTKLLIPMMIALFGVIIAVTIPAVIQLFTVF